MEFTGRLITGDFEDNTMTFEIEGDMVLQSGRYRIVQIEVGNKVKNNVDLANVSNCTYLFFRADGFYPLELKDDDDAIANAECNKGTLQVQDTQGRIVWAYSC